MRGGRMLWVAVWASSAFTSSASVLGIVSSALAGVAVGRVSTSGAWDRLRQSQAQQKHESTAEPAVGLFESEGWEGDAEVSDWEPFRLLGRSMIEYIANYYTEVESRPVRAQVEPGYLKERLTQREFPLKGEKWSEIMADVESHIMPGITHWQHPRFFAWYPANSSPPAMLGELLATMLNVIGFSWEASPGATELEILVMDLLARAMGLPDCFLSQGEGGGVIQGSASEGTLVALLAARTKALKHMRLQSPGLDDHELFSKMTLYASDQAHSSVQKAANIAGLGANLRLLPTRQSGNDNSEPYSLVASELSTAMRADRLKGLTPIFVCANVGSTNSCAVDPVRAIGQVYRREAEQAAEGTNRGKPPLLAPWLHVDAAYAGATTICPENRWILDGIEAADSYLFNLHKWLLVNFDCTGMWVKRSACLVDALSITPEILRSKEYQSGQVSDFRDLQVPLGRKFRSLKIWFTMRAFGLQKIREYIRGHIRLTRDFAAVVAADERFEIVAPVRFGLVCFRFKGSDAANEVLRARVVSSGKAFLSSTKLGGRTCLRTCVGGPRTQERHLREFWDLLRHEADAVTSAHH